MFNARGLVKEMCDLAINNLKSIEMLSKMKTQKYVHDFEYGHFADLMFEERKEGCANLFIFIGSTIGNMIDRHRALANIRDSMTEGDLLWVGTCLYKGVNTFTNLYSKLEVGSVEYINKCKGLVSVLEAFGMKNWMDFGKITVEEVDVNGLIKYYFEVKKPFILEIPKNNHSKKYIRLKYLIGDRIVLNRLKNFLDQDLINEFREANFNIKMLNVNKDYDYALVLASVQ